MACFIRVNQLDYKLKRDQIIGLTKLMRLQNEAMVYSMEYAFISNGSQWLKGLMVYIYKSEIMLPAKICSKSFSNPTFFFLLSFRINLFYFLSVVVFVTTSVVLCTLFL